MPAITTHYIFADSHLPKETAFRKATVLASQGPDPFFFFGQLPWSRHDKKLYQKINHFGNALHREDITDIYYAMIEYAKTSEDKELLFAFIRGLFLHYVLDRNCHRYVYAKTGFSDDPILAKFYSSCHTKTESAIDKLLGEEYGCWNENPDYCLSLDDESLMKISKMIYEANRVSDKDPSIQEDSYFLSVHDYRKAMKFINKPHAFKRWLTRRIGAESMAFSLNYPRDLKKVYGDIDFLNEAHREWPDPTTGKMSKKSFKELMDDAWEDYLRISPSLEEAFLGKNTKETIRKWVDNITHNGNPVGTKMQYMDVFFSK